MRTVNIFRAKSDLSRLVEAVETGAEAEIVIARNGRPAARLVPVAPRARGPRVGVVKIDADIPPDDPELSGIVTAMFEGRPSKKARAKRKRKP